MDDALLKKDYPLIDIIVPVYNTEEYLRDCIDSLISQTYSNLEILIADDCSSDRSLAICREYAKRDERIRVISCEHGGVSRARNVCLEQIRGDYFTFVDSDDFVESDYIESLYVELVRSGADIAKCEYYTTDRYGIRTSEKIDNGGTVRISVSEYDYAASYDYRICTLALYPDYIAKKVRFAEDLSNGEDTLFYAQAMNQVDSVVHIFSTLYAYRIREESASHGQYDEKKFSAVIAWQRIMRTFEARGGIVFSSSVYGYGTCCESCLRMLALGGGISREHFNFLVQQFRSNLHQILKYKKRKLSPVLFAIAPELYIFFLARFKYHNTSGWYYTN